MLKGFTHARLGCGCRISFREGVEGSPVTVVVAAMSPACTLSLHVRDLPLFDYREALRPSAHRRRVIGVADCARRFPRQWSIADHSIADPVSCDNPHRFLRW